MKGIEDSQNQVVQIFSRLMLVDTFIKNHSGIKKSELNIFSYFDLTKVSLFLTMKIYLGNVSLCFDAKLGKDFIRRNQALKNN